MHQTSFFSLLVVLILTIAHAEIAQPKNPLGCAVAGIDYNTVLGSGAIWQGKPFLHAWIGAYYNGTVSFSASFSKDSANCSAQEQVQKFDSLPGVLSIISPSYYQGLGRRDEFIYLLQAWDEGTDLFSEPRLRGMPLGVRVDIRSVPEFHVGSLLSNTETACAMKTVTKGEDLNFTCDYRWDQNVSSNDPWNDITSDDSYVRLPASTCNGQGQSEMIFANFENTTAASREDSSSPPATRHESSKATGTFDTESAEFTLKGPFQAKFFADWSKLSADERWNEMYALGGEKSKGLNGEGIMEITFKGTTDSDNSHGIKIFEGGKVEFVEDPQKSATMERRLIHPCFDQLPPEVGGFKGTNRGGGGSGSDAGTMRIGGLMYVFAVGLMAAMLC